MMIRTIFWKKNSVVMIDQNALPLVEKLIVCRSYRDVIVAIKNLTIRGAPAIGVAAALGAALGALELPPLPPEQFDKRFEAVCDEISQARPTARNLFWALDRMKRVARKTSSADQPKRVANLIREARRICEEDISANRRMGSHGSVLLADGDNVLTHCNAGALATAEYGTALGVIRAAAQQGKKLHIFVDETRPVLQGARLTAWELKKEKIPFTLITDNMAGFLMQQGKIDKIIVGADRIAANGDAANKIGTYTLAVLAKAHGVPFYIAAPLATMDTALRTGRQIPIEERNGTEVTRFNGAPCAPKGTTAYNPAFDVTPAKLITAIITEKGILRKPFRNSIARLHQGEKHS